MKQWNSGDVNLIRTLVSQILSWDTGAISDYKHPAMLRLNPLGLS